MELSKHWRLAKGTFRRSTPEWGEEKPHWEIKATRRSSAATQFHDLSLQRGGARRRPGRPRQEDEEIAEDADQHVLRRPAFGHRAMFVYLDGHAEGVSTDIEVDSI